MPSKEKTVCERCGGWGVDDVIGLACACEAIEMSSKVAVGSLCWPSGKSLDSTASVGKSVATVNKPLTVGAQANDAIRLLYTHGLITSGMRNHARKKLATFKG